MRRTLTALFLKMTDSDMVTCPSPAMAVFPFFLTAQMVVPLNSMLIYKFSFIFPIISSERSAYAFFLSALSLYTALSGSKMP